MTLALQDWRELPAARILPLLMAEQRGWRESLGWDVSQSWASVEPARMAGLLPGLVARDGDGRIRGWTFFGLHDDAWQVAALTADGPEVTSALVDGVVQHAASSPATSVLAFTRERAPGLREAFAARGLAVEPYRYLSAAPPVASSGDDQREGLRPWASGDLEPFVDVCARAYAGAAHLRPFARGGSMREWRDYVRQLVEHQGCGAFLPEASVVAVERGAVIGGVVCTRLDPNTAHLAQVVVDPAARGRHIGMRLVERARRGARTEGFGRVTLLVASSNAAAAGLYARLGFSETETFLAASSDYPRRSTSVAAATGGDSTLR